MTDKPLSDRERGALEHAEEEKVTDGMMAIGALCLREYFDRPLSPRGFMEVARHVFAVMRVEEAQRSGPTPKRDLVS
jgi:hypothetical protein